MVVLGLGLGSAIGADVGAGPATAPGDRRGSSTAVSSEVKVRAWRARRVHTNTHTRARRPLITHYPPTPARRMRDHTPPPLRPPPRNHPSTPATDHEAPRLPDAWMSAASEGPLRRVAGFFSATPRHAAPSQPPAGSRRPELNVSACCVPSKSRLTARSRLASLSPPTRSHDSCCRPKTGRL